LDELLRDLRRLSPRLEEVLERLTERVEALEDAEREDDLERHRSALGLLEDLSESLADVLETLPDADLDL
jgi:hypothetical protein